MNPKEVIFKEISFFLTFIVWTKTVSSKYLQCSTVWNNIRVSKWWQFSFGRTVSLRQASKKHTWWLKQVPASINTWVFHFTFVFHEVNEPINHLPVTCTDLFLKAKFKHSWKLWIMKIVYSLTSFTRHFNTPEPV